MNYGVFRCISVYFGGIWCISVYFGVYTDRSTTALYILLCTHREFLTGFQKRKNERRKKAKDDVLLAFKEEKRRCREKVGLLQLGLWVKNFGS